jgi:hypothetical protein
MKFTWLTSWSLSSQPPELWEINFCCLRHTNYGIFLWQLQQTNAFVSGLCVMKNFILANGLLGMVVAHAWGASYIGDHKEEDCGLRAGKIWDHTWKITKPKKDKKLYLIVPSSMYWWTLWKCRLNSFHVLMYWKMMPLT